jgi:hypothetical protein
MRKADIQAIRITIALLQNECHQHRQCKNCKLFKSGKGCIIDCPPQFLDADAIIKCFM